MTEIITSIAIKKLITEIATKMSGSAISELTKKIFGQLKGARTENEAKKMLRELLIDNSELLDLDGLEKRLDDLIKKNGRETESTTIVRKNIKKHKEHRSKVFVLGLEGSTRKGGIMKKRAKKPATKKRKSPSMKKNRSKRIKKVGVKRATKKSSSRSKRATKKSSSRSK